MSKELIRNVKQYSIKLEKAILNEFELIAYRYCKVKNYVYSRFGSINGLKYIRKNGHRKIRDEWVKTGFANQWKLPARYWKLALNDAFGSIKSQWSNVKRIIKGLINQKKNLNDTDKHYINYILKINDFYYKVLTYQDLQNEIKQFVNNQIIEIEKKLKSAKTEKKIEILLENKLNYKNLNIKKLNSLIRRLTRKHLNKSISKKFRAFQIDDAMYSFSDSYINFTSLIPRKRFKIKLTDNQVRSKTLRIIIDKEKSRIEVHSSKKLKVKKLNREEKIIGVDKGFSKMIFTSENSFYGKNLSKKLIFYSDKLNEINSKRNNIFALVKKHKAKSNFKKVQKLRAM